MGGWGRRAGSCPLKPALGVRAAAAAARDASHPLDPPITSGSHLIGRRQRLSSPPRCSCFGSEFPRQSPGWTGGGSHTPQRAAPTPGRERAAQGRSPGRTRRAPRRSCSPAGSRRSATAPLPAARDYWLLAPAAAEKAARWALVAAAPAPPPPPPPAAAAPAPRASAQPRARPAPPGARPPLLPCAREGHEHSALAFCPEKQ